MRYKHLSWCMVLGIMLLCLWRILSRTALAGSMQAKPYIKSSRTPVSCNRMRRV